MKESKTFPWPTVGGYDLYEVMSALQKSIRRGLEDDALFWGTEMCLSEYTDHAWKRLLVIASEDVGMADTTAVVAVKTLHDLYTQYKKDDSARLWFVHAILILVYARKSRCVDNAAIVYFEGPREERHIPDYALDIHTPQGKAMGRGYEHFFDVGATLENVVRGGDIYWNRAREIRCRKK